MMHWRGMPGRGARVAALAAVLLAAGCGYYNSLYNANRHYSEAQRAQRSGDIVTANRGYREAIERAAVSYRKYPSSRWADDALLLIGRARFELLEDEAAVAAMRALLAQSTNRSQRALAHGYAGAATFRAGNARAAAVHLDSAVAGLRPDSEDGAFVRLWRARALFSLGANDAAWTDLELAARHGRTSFEAALEGARRAGMAGDSAHFATFVDRIAAARLPAPTTDEVDSVLTQVARAWSHAAVLHATAPLERAPWPAATRDGITLTRARIAAAAGDTAYATELAARVYGGVRGGLGSRARLVEARIRLAGMEDPDDLEDVRQLLRPAFDERQALDLMRSIAATQNLVRRGDRASTALSLFAAAEIARDELQAPFLARRIFLDFHRLQQDLPWSGKAVVAAHMTAPNEQTAALIDQLRDNPYVRAARGVYDPELAAVEERIAYGTLGLRAEALADAIAQDAVVGRAVAALDSARTAARLDSVRITCGVMIDTLKIAGIRADSTRSACLRGDSARVAFVLRADTVLLRDTSRVVTPRRGGERVVADTIL